METLMISISHNNSNWDINFQPKNAQTDVKLIIKQINFEVWGHIEFHKKLHYKYGVHSYVQVIKEVAHTWHSFSSICGSELKSDIEI